MQSPFGLLITLELGTRRRELSAGELARALGNPAVTPKLLALVLASGPVPSAPGPQPIHSPEEEEKRGKGGDEKELSRLPVTQNAFENISEQRLRSGKWDRGFQGE